MVTAEKSLISY